MSTAVEVWKKKAEAVKSSIAITNPEIADRLTLEAIYGYFNMPDSSFGWNSNNAMSDELKQACAIAHLKAGAEPGYGHIFFLGTKLYQSAEFVRMKANADPEWKIKGEAKFIPFSEDEKMMFGIEQGDMACKVVMEVECKGVDMVIEGHGIIGKDELEFRSSKGNAKPGLDTKKNRVMSLKTRAMRDLYNRFYPAKGLPVSDIVDEEKNVQDGFKEQVKATPTEALPAVREKIQDEIEAEVVEEKIEDYKKLLKETLAEGEEKGLSKRDILKAFGITTQKELLAQEPSIIADTIDDMNTFIESHQAKGDPHIESAMDRLSYQIKRVTEEGGAPMKILGENPHNILERRVFEEIEKAYKILQQWEPEKKQEEIEDPFEDFANAIEEAGPRTRPIECLKIYSSLEKWLEIPKVKENPRVLEYLQYFIDAYLEPGDGSFITEGLRLATSNNDFSKLEELKKARKPL